MLTHRPLYPPVYGYSRVIVDTYTVLASRGCRVCIVSVTARGRRHYRLADKVDYVELSEPAQAFVKLALTRVFLRLTKGELLFKHLVWLAKEYSSEKIVESIASVSEEYLGRPDIVITETIYPGFLAEKLANKFGTKYVVRIHNIEALYISSLTRVLRRRALSRIRFLEEHVLGRAGKVYALSYKDSFIVKEFYGVQAIYIPPIIKVGRHDQERVLRKLGVKENSYYLFIASPHKPNIVFLKKIIECWRNIGSNKYKLVIGGSISPVARKLLKNGIKGIVVAGFLSKDEVATLVKNSYVCLAPHHGHGVPIKLVEALLLGTPSITTANALETIRGLKHGYNIYAVENIGEICRAIRELMVNNSLYQDIKSGVAEFSRLLDPEELAHMFINELSRLDS